MTIGPASRVNYFDRQFIRLPELRDEQAYHVALRRRHNLSHHSWGIVAGLEIVLEEDGRTAIRPGLAIDGYGRELLLLDRQPIGRDVFDRYGTLCLDFWLEYLLEFADDRVAPVECGGGDPRRRYRAIERAQIVPTRGAAKPDPRHPPHVPAEALQAPLALATPDDPGQRWPVYLGRVTMDLTQAGQAQFTVDTSDRVYAGLNAEVLDHPGNAARLELGRRPQAVDTRRIGDDEFRYQPDTERDFAIFVPRPPDDQRPGDPLQPTIAIYKDGTQIRGTTTVHGNLILDGASLQFPDGVDVAAGKTVDTGGQPAIYRAKGDAGDELRIDLGKLDDGDRRLVIGVTKDGEFSPAMEIAFPNASAQATPKPEVRILGDLRIEGNIDAEDVRTRTVTEEVAALLTGMVQAGIAAGGGN